MIKKLIKKFEKKGLSVIIYPIAFLLLAILDALCHKNYMKVRRWAYFLVGGANLYCLNHEDEVKALTEQEVEKNKIRKQDGKTEIDIRAF